MLPRVVRSGWAMREKLRNIRSAVRPLLSLYFGAGSLLVVGPLDEDEPLCGLLDSLLALWLVPAVVAVRLAVKVRFALGSYRA